MPKSFEIDVYKSTYPVYCNAGSIDMLSTEGLGWVRLARKCFQVSLVRFLLFSDFCDVTTPEWPRACHIERLLWADNLIVKLLRRSYLPFGPEKAHFTATKNNDNNKIKIWSIIVSIVLLKTEPKFFWTKRPWRWNWLGNYKADYEQSLFFLSPSKETRDTRKWPRAGLKARDSLTKSKEKEMLLAV